MIWRKSNRGLLSVVEVGVCGVSIAFPHYSTDPKKCLGPQTFQRLGILTMSPLIAFESLAGYHYKHYKGVAVGQGTWGPIKYNVSHLAVHEESLKLIVSRLTAA